MHSAANHQKDLSSISVIVGMSGGVDSSVAAYLLKQQGYAVAGLFMKNWDEDDGTEYCTAVADLADAQATCDALNIPLHCANFAAEYWDNVFEHFLTEYRRLRTPNPDILCNREIKFRQFVDYAQTLGADFIATGHYVKRIDQPERVIIEKGIDANKDQTYFLQAVPKPQLEKCLFPLGDWLKSDVRKLATDLGLKNHRKKDSTGICFIGERRFADFLRTYITDQPGPITDPEGRILGTHRGLHYYTIGQRQGINIGGKAGRPESPWYVAAKHQRDNRLEVTQDERALYSGWLHAVDVNWLEDIALPLRCQAKVRYRQQDQHCRVERACNNRLLVHFDEPQRAVAEGQYIAFYDNEQLLGGGCIDLCPRPQTTTPFSEPTTYV
jgi:tRNA-specific 2-thiouridylase